ncbi:hypothetical protein [Spirosoma sp. KCTC 42546]|nr:hypothetical protein [Spirosoma sp. KCTC 42546]
MNNERGTAFTELQDRQQLAELANRLFMYTDSRNWEGLVNEVFRVSTP